MNINLLNTLLLSELKKSVEMLAVAVYATRRYKAHEMQSTAICLNLRSNTYQCLIGEEIAVLDSLGNTGQRLIDDTASTDIGMTNLGVTHLTIRQTNMLARSKDLSVRELCLQTINYRSLCDIDGIVWIIWVTITIAIHNN